MEKELQTLLQRCHSNDWVAMKDLLAYIRTHKLRRAELVLKYGGLLLTTYKSKLGDEVWVITEQVFLASLDAHVEDWSVHCLEMLEAQFPRSRRVRRLSGMLRESTGHFDKATEIYDELLEEDPTDVHCARRKIVILKTQGKVAECIEELNKYLESFCADVDAWQELADLYISQQQFSKASFCYEELILANPQNYLYHLRLAELLYSQGGMDNLLKSRQYVCQAMELNSTHPRVLWALAMTTNAIASTPAGSSKKSDVTNSQLFEISSTGLQNSYTLASQPKLKLLVDKVLQSLHA
eukprot:GILK01001697.1.p1 GENE.GILK01001697.1~~GILK01001697.1.p1  ORF type:complete len:309 (+),score=41.44 GILK01001697.1:41-928(+)